MLVLPSPFISEQSLSISKRIKSITNLISRMLTWLSLLMSPLSSEHSIHSVVSWYPTKLSIHDGYGGQNSLFDILNPETKITSRLQILSGINPLSWLSFNLKIFKFVRLPILSGISPLRSRLLYKNNPHKFVRLPISDGSSPEKLLYCKYVHSKLVRLPNSDGINPSRLLKPNNKVFTFTKFSTSSVITPKKLLPPKFNQSKFVRFQYFQVYLQ